MTAPAVTVTFGLWTVAVFQGPLCDWFGGRQDGRTRGAAIAELREMARQYQEVYSAKCNGFSDRTAQAIQ